MESKTEDCFKTSRYLANKRVYIYQMNHIWSKTSVKHHSTRKVNKRWTLVRFCSELTNHIPVIRPSCSTTSRSCSRVCHVRPASDISESLPSSSIAFSSSCASPRWRAIAKTNSSTSAVRLRERRVIMAAFVDDVLLVVRARLIYTSA